MASWVLVGWAHQFRAELIAIAPNRDKASDGSVGDLAHAQGVSGHNPDDTPGVTAERQDADNIPEVRAIDVDKDLRVPGLTMAMIVAYLVGRCRAGLERRLIYIIFNGVIWTASSGWQARTYTGNNPHDEHAHLSGHPDHDDDRRPFGLASLLPQEDDMFGEADRALLKAAVEMLTNPDGRETIGMLYKRLAVGKDDRPGATPVTHPTLTSIGAGQKALAVEVAALRATVEGLAATIRDGGGSVDTVGILAGVDRAVSEAVEAINAETRDAVADLGEGGAALVRAGATPPA